MEARNGGGLSAPAPALPQRLRLARACSAEAMPALADLLPILHTVLLASFLAVTVLLALVTAANRLRMRHVLMSWRAGRPLAFPVGPALFVTLVLAFLAYTLASGRDLSPLLFAGYLAGGGLWFVSGLFSAAFVVTGCGLIRNTGRTGQAVGWGQVVDYFETVRGDRHDYVFIYLDGDGVRRRLEMSVPADLQARFQEILDEHLDGRFDFPVEETLGNKALER